MRLMYVKLLYSIIWLFTKSDWQYLSLERSAQRIVEFALRCNYIVQKGCIVNSCWYAPLQEWYKAPSGATWSIIQKDKRGFIVAWNPQMFRCFIRVYHELYIKDIFNNKRFLASKINLTMLNTNVIWLTNLYITVESFKSMKTFWGSVVVSWGFDCIEYLLTIVVFQVILKHDSYSLNYSKLIWQFSKFSVV